MVDLNLPDNLWLRIQPPAKRKYAGLLCPTCIIGRIEMLHLVQDGDAQYGAYFLSPESQQKNKEENKNSAALALAIDRFQELAGKNVEAEFSVGEIIDTLEEIAQEPCPDGEHNTPKDKIKPCSNKECKKYFAANVNTNCRGYNLDNLDNCPDYRA